ncbi:MAG: helix-hairpin-helix domain-containing protein, partial [Anaerolineae bacterium]
SGAEAADVGEYDADLTGSRGPGFASGAAGSLSDLPDADVTADGGPPGVEAGLVAGGIAFGGALAQLGDQGEPAGARAASCPQDLSKVMGIGQAYETKLYAAGIGSFWQLATADDDTLRRIFGIKDFQKIDLGTIKADARRLAEDSNTVGRGWDGSQPDDFESMEGIGAVFEGRLYDGGICTLRALADATEAQLEALCPAPAWRRPDYADWIRQAKARLGEV